MRTLVVHQGITDRIAFMIDHSQKAPIYNLYRITFLQRIRGYVEMLDSLPLNAQKPFPGRKLVNDLNLVVT